MRYRDHSMAGSERKSILVNSLLTGSILLVASILCECLYQLGIGEQNIIIVMVLAVFITAAATDGYVYGLIGTLVGVVIYDFLVTAPRLGFSFTVGFPITFVTMLLVVLVASTVTTRIKKQVEVAREKEYRAELLYRINRTLLSGQDQQSIAEEATRYLADDLYRSIALFTEFSEAAPPQCYCREWPGDVSTAFFQSVEGQQAAVQAARRKQPVETPNACYLPVIQQGIVYGVFGISCGSNAEWVMQHQALIDLITEQTAQALHMRALSVQQRDAMILAETEKARNSFLRGISHDLRTPLTSIIGASSTFLESRESLAISTQIHLVEGIQSDSQWLLSMVENILSVTRIQQSDMAINKSREIAEEVVGEAVALFRRRYPGAEISVQQSNDLLLVPMDPILITQVLNNLLDNSKRHAGDMPCHIQIEMHLRAGCAEFIVSDTGPGISQEALPHLFGIQPARTGHGEDSSRGLGMGLSLCKAIVEAHGGKIWARNLPEGGAQFRFVLPMEAEAKNG